MCHYKETDNIQHASLRQLTGLLHVVEARCLKLFVMLTLKPKLHIRIQFGD